MNSAELFFGTSGWSYNEWVGPFYEKKRGMFTNYTKLFHTTEINSTFYRYPTPSLIKGLYRTAPSGFTFAAKIPRLISHKKRLRLSQGVEDDLNSFLFLMQPLAEKLGPILIQLPPSFAYDKDASALEEFLGILPSNYHFAVEFRHLSWVRPETWDMLRQHKVAYTIVDEPLLPPELEVTADFAYIRWHGHGTRPWYDYDYKPEELQSWVPRVKAVAEKAKWVYGYFNNHFKWQVKKGDSKWGYPGAVKNCVEMLEILGSATEEQKKILERINQWREDKLLSDKKGVAPREPGVAPLESYVEAEEGLSVGDLLLKFMGAGRLSRAEQIEDDEIEIVKDSKDYIEAKIRRYTIHVDLGEKVIRHDCADWGKGLGMKRICKHVGKLFLILPEKRASTILRDIWEERDRWKFET